MSRTSQQVVPAPRMRWRDRYALYFALLVAWVAMAGSLYFSEVRHFVPCMWCWYQRILMYPLALGILPVGLLRRDENLPYYTAFFSVVGMVASTYHYLLQKTNWFLGAGACLAGVPCNVQYINWFGFVTIPFLALTAFILIFFASVVVLTSRQELWEEEEYEQRTPWIPVVAIIGAVVLAFAPSFLTAEPAEASSSVTSFTPIPTVEGGEAPDASTAVLAEGERLYRETCAACHGPQAMGVAGLGAPLAGTERTETSTPEEWVRLVREGIPADHPDNETGVPMPPSGGRPDLTNQELEAIFAYLQALN